MSKMNGVDFSSITALSGKSLVDAGGGAFDPVAGTGTYTETVYDTGLLRIGGMRNSSKPGYKYDPNPITNFSSDVDGKYLSARFDSSSDWTKIEVYGTNATGDNATWAINSDGELWGRGRSSSFAASTTAWSQYTQSGIVDNGWTDISCGAGVFLGINSGKLYFMGSQAYAGYGSTSYSYSSLRQVGSDTDWVKVSCGSQHSLAIKGSDNKVYAAGRNSNGRTGLNTTSGTASSWTLVNATNLDNATNEDITHIFAGYENSLIIQNGKAFFFGYNRTNNNYGLTSGAKTTPQQIGKYNDAFKTDWSSGYAGNYSSHLIDTSGKLWFTGNSNFGAPGNGTTTNNISANYIQIGSDTNWTSVSCPRVGFGSHYQVVAVKGGKAYYWGSNQDSNIIDSSTTVIKTPTLIKSGDVSAITPPQDQQNTFIVGSFS